MQVASWIPVVVSQCLCAGGGSVQEAVLPRAASAATSSQTIRTIRTNMVTKPAQPRGTALLYTNAPDPASARQTTGRCGRTGESPIFSWMSSSLHAQWTRRRGPTIRITLACERHRVAGSHPGAAGALRLRDWRAGSQKPGGGLGKRDGGSVADQGRSGDGKEPRDTMWASPRAGCGPAADGRADVWFII